MKCLRLIYENNILSGVIIICSCASIFPPCVIPSGPQTERWWTPAEKGTIAAFNPLPTDMTIGLHHCVRAYSYHRGQSTRLGWAVVSVVSASFLFLRTNRIIIPSRGEDFLMCFVVSDAITVAIMWSFIFWSPWILPSLSLSLMHTHETIKAFSMCAKKKKEIKQAEANVSRSIFVCCYSTNLFNNVLQVEKKQQHLEPNKLW